MLKFFAATMLVASFATVSVAVAQNSSTTTTTTRQRTTSTQGTTSTQASPKPSPSPAAKESTKQAASGQTTKGGTTTAKSTAASEQGPAAGVKAAFDKLVDGIQRANVDEVTSVYWNSPQLVLFNSNGTVTRGWEQMRANRASSYPNLKDVKLTVNDLKITMLGRDGALVTCLWKQSQTAKGAPESAAGRMTLVFRKEGNTWKAVHLHTSPDAPDPSRILPSEQTEKSAVKSNPE
jgi:ketosteroid isomerase-like protein